MTMMISFLTGDILQNTHLPYCTPQIILNESQKYLEHRVFNFTMQNRYKIISSNNISQLKCVETDNFYTK